MAVYFNGRLLVSPSVESQVLDQGMQNLNPAIGNVLAIVGRSDGGLPKTPLRIGSPAQAAELLRSGELLDAVNLAFAPSQETSAPSIIIAVRVNPAVGSSLKLKDTLAADVISLSSSDAGLYTNQIKVKVESASGRGKKLSTQLGNRYFVRDNVYRDAFTVAYSGAEATATLSITGTSVSLTAGANPAVVIDLNVFQTVQDLVDRINGEVGFSADAISSSVNSPALNGLDYVSSQDIKTAPYTATANLQAVVDWFNSASEGLIDASREAGAGTEPVNVPWTTLTGGSNGTVTNEDWSDCFTALETVDTQWVVPLSESSSIWAMADSHCQFMSSVGKSERRAFVGAGLGKTVDDAIADASSINSDRTAYVYPGHYGIDSKGNTLLMPAYMTAALVAGGFAGLTAGETMTNKPVRALGTEFDLSSAVETDKLVDGGVLAVHKSKSGGHRVVKGISTWLIDDRHNRVEISTGVAADYVSRAVRMRLQSFVGRRASPLTLSEVVSATDSILRDLSQPEPIGLGLLVGEQPYRGITARISGDVLSVSFECSPVVPINYVLISVHTTIYTGSVSTTV